MHENSHERQRATGSSITAAGSNSRPAPQRPMTSSTRFRFAEPPAAAASHPVFSDSRMRRGVLSQLPVLLPVSATSRTLWNKPRYDVAAPRRRSARSNIVTTDYGWIDSGEVGLSDESDKENRRVEQEERVGEDRDLVAGDRQSSLGGGQVCEIDWKSPNSSSSMDVDEDDHNVDMKPCSGFEAAPSGSRLTHLRCRPDGPLRMPVQLRRHRLPLGTIDEATETSTTKSMISVSESSPPGADNLLDEPEEELDVVAPEPEIPPTKNVVLPASRSELSTPPEDEDCGRWNPDEASFQSDKMADVSVRRQCGGWRFASSRPRLTVTEFCRRRDSETKKRHRSTSVSEDVISVNDSVVSLDVSTKRRRTSLKVCIIIVILRRMDKMYFGDR